jgi:dienelactone hydrolase
MHSSNYNYHHDNQELHGYVAYDDKVQGKRPAVIVVHDWTGRNEFACQKAQLLAEMGYVGFALDMYGQGRIGVNNEEKSAMMQPLVSDRAFLRARILSAFEFVKQMPNVDSNRIAVLGFCFGGLCALDLARSGANIKGAISFHGLLSKPEGLKPEHIKAKILVLHGYEDPMVKPDQVSVFCQEMTEAKVDWQVHMYGNIKHAFTNPLAHDEQLGLIYHEVAAKRSWQATTNFLQEIFTE